MALMVPLSFPLLGMLSASRLAVPSSIGHFPLLFFDEISSSSFTQAAGSHSIITVAFVTCLCFSLTPPDLCAHLFASTPFRRAGGHCAVYLHSLRFQLHVFALSLASFLNPILEGTD